MMLVECLRDFGIWCVKGRRLWISNNLARCMEKRCNVRIIREISYEEYKLMEG